MEGCGNMLQTQALAASSAIKFAYDGGFRLLVLEVRSKELHRQLHIGPPCLSAICVLVDDICHLVNFFSAFVFFCYS